MHVCIHVAMHYFFPPSNFYTHTHTHTLTHAHTHAHTRTHTHTHAHTQYEHDKNMPPILRKQLNDIIQRGPLAQVDELEKDLIWKFRLGSIPWGEPCNWTQTNFAHIFLSRMHLLESSPSALPRLLTSVKWNQYKDVAVVMEPHLPNIISLSRCVFNLKHTCMLICTNKIFLLPLGFLSSSSLGIIIRIYMYSIES